MTYSMAAIVIGAWACATLSVVDSRYFSRASWMLPLAVCLVVFRHVAGAKIPNGKATSVETTPRAAGENDAEAPVSRR